MPNEVKQKFLEHASEIANQIDEKAKCMTVGGNLARGYQWAALAEVQIGVMGVEKLWVDAQAAAVEHYFENNWIKLPYVTEDALQEISDLTVKIIEKKATEILGYTPKQWQDKGFAGQRPNEEHYLPYYLTSEYCRVHLSKQGQ